MWTWLAWSQRRGPPGGPPDAASLGGRPCRFCGDGGQVSGRQCQRPAGRDPERGEAVIIRVTVEETQLGGGEPVRLGCEASRGMLQTRLSQL